MKNQDYNCQMALDHLIAEMDQNRSLNDILEELIPIYPDCEGVLRSTVDTWDELKELKVPKPSEAMHNTFYTMLDGIESENKRLPRSNKILRLPFVRAAAVIALLIGAFFAGKNLDTTYEESDKLLSKNDPAPNQNELIFAGSSAINRLDKVQNVKELNNPDHHIFEALNQVLLNDENINVRLSAIEVMMNFSEYPKVREYLIKAIPVQESPIVQIALADAMRSLQETNSVDPIKKMIESGELDLEVKNHYEKIMKEIM